MNIQLQPYTDKDKIWLEELRRAAYLDLFIATWGGWDENRHQRHWASCIEQGNISIIKLDGVSVGMVQVTAEDESVEIDEIQIFPEFQGRGVGTQVLTKIIEDTHSKRYSVTLSAGNKNSRAIALYQRLGFKLKEETDVKVYFEFPPIT